MNRTSPKSQSGVTMIELLVSLVIGLAILTALSRVFSSSKSTYSLQTRMAALQENGRFAMAFLQRDIRNAGQPYNEDLFLPFAPPTWPAGGVTGPAVAAPFNSADNVGVNNSDRLSIRYRAMAAGTDCLGNPIAANAIVVVTYSVAAGANGVRQLNCAAQGQAAQPIVDGIESMQVLYGIDTVPAAPNGDGFADAYVNAATVTAAQWLRQVVSVRISVLASTILPVAGDMDADNSRTFFMLDAGPIGPITANFGGRNQNIRARVFTTTVEVRNRTPVPLAP